MTASAARRVESRTAPADWRPADLVHALAQLPDGVSLRLESAGHDSLRLLARAYGIEDRLELGGTHGPPDWRFEGASSAGAAGDTMAELVESLWPEDAGPSAAARDDRCLAGHRVALVTNIPTHYRVPLFNGVARRAARAGAELRVFFLGEPPRAQPWLAPEDELESDHEYVASARLPRWLPLSSRVDRVRPPRVPSGLGRRLRAFAPSMVVSGGFSFASIAARRHAARSRIPFGLWSGDVAHQLHNRSYPAVRTRQREWLARKADFGIAYGWLAARYLTDLAPGLPTVIARNTSVAGAADHPAGGSGDGLDLLAVADLSVPEKGLETVLEAMALVPDPGVRLNVIGPQPPEHLGRLAARDERIAFLGPRSHSEATAAFARSDAFVFPSRMDIFGLALLEAMAAGLPAISSPVPGSVADLAVPGRNCLMAAARDPRSWAEAIEALAGSPGLRASVGAAAQSTVRRRWTMAHGVEGMMAGLRLGALRAGRQA